MLIKDASFLFLDRKKLILENYEFLELFRF